MSEGGEFKSVGLHREQEKNWWQCWTDINSVIFSKSKSSGHPPSCNEYSQILLWNVKLLICGFFCIHHIQYIQKKMRFGELKYLCTILLAKLLAGVCKAANAGAPFIYFFGCTTKSGDKIVDDGLYSDAKIVCTVCINGYYSIFSP